MGSWDFLLGPSAPQGGSGLGQYSYNYLEQEAFRRQEQEYRRQHDHMMAQAVQQWKYDPRDLNFLAMGVEPPRASSDEFTWLRQRVKEILWHK